MAGARALASHRPVYSDRARPKNVAVRVTGSRAAITVLIQPPTGCRARTIAQSRTAVGARQNTGKLSEPILPNALRMRHLAVATSLILAGTTAQAADRSDLHREDVSRVNRNYQLASQGVGSATQAQERHAEMLGLDAESRLSVLTHRQDAKGTHYYRYQQTFRGVPILGEQVVVSERNGLIRNLFGRKVSGLAAELPRNPRLIGTARALAAGKAAALGSRAGSLAVERQKVRQVIFIGDDKRARMAYEVELFADKAGGGAPTRPFVVLDAGTGAVLRKWEGLAHSLVGTGPGGNAKTGEYEYGTDFGFNDVVVDGANCTMSNANVKTVNLKRHHCNAAYAMPARHRSGHQRRVLATERRTLFRQGRV